MSQAYGLNAQGSASQHEFSSRETVKDVGNDKPPGEGSGGTSRGGAEPEELADGADVNLRMVSGPK